MNKKTLDYIKTLSKTDEKNLTGKALKTSEEVGELAKVVLPYENAHATTHRFIDKKRILEECADTFLCIQSIVYDLDFSDEEFEEMINHKMKVWADLQAREGRIKYPIPYEIHVTVDIKNNENISNKQQKDLIEFFKKDCKTIGVKPILLDLHLKDGKNIKDMMTSSTFMGNNKEAYEEMKRITFELQSNGWKVIREKIETIPWHPAAPSKKHKNPTMPPNCYFECHLNCLCTNEKLDTLKQIAEKHGARKSSNIFKKYKDDTFTIMVTYRDYESCYENFKKKLEELKTELFDFNFTIEKEIVEFSIYDTKISHDSIWISQE